MLYGHSLAFTDNGSESGNRFIGGFDALGLQGLVDTATTDDGTGMPEPRLLGLPADVRHHHRRADQRRDRRPGQVRRLGGVHRRLGDARLLPGRPLGVGRRLADSLGIEDFAGGTVVHINAGAAALRSALWCSASDEGWRKEPMRPHNLPLVLLGAGLLWFGWFGFNAGSELAVDGTAGLAFMNTQIATAVAAGAWIVVEKLRDGHATTPRGRLGRRRRAGRDHARLWVHRPLGGDRCSAWSAGAVCCLRGRPEVQARLRRLARRGRRAPGRRRVRRGVAGLPGRLPPPGPSRARACSTAAVSRSSGCRCSARSRSALYSFIVTWILGKIIDKTMGFRVSEEDEVTGVDLTSHAETGYDFGTIHLGHTPGHAVTDADQEVTDRESEPVTGTR